MHFVNPTSTGASRHRQRYHPVEERKLTIAELKRICAFPDDFKLTGTYSQQWERLGRAVPPVMMAKVVRRITARVRPFQRALELVAAK